MLRDAEGRDVATLDLHFLGTEMEGAGDPTNLRSTH